MAIKCVLRSPGIFSRHVEFTELPQIGDRIALEYSPSEYVEFVVKKRIFVPVSSAGVDPDVILVLEPCDENKVQ